MPATRKWVAFDGPLSMGRFRSSIISLSQCEPCIVVRLQFCNKSSALTMPATRRWAAFDRQTHEDGPLLIVNNVNANHTLLCAVALCIGLSTMLWPYVHLIKGSLASGETLFPLSFHFLFSSNTPFSRQLHCTMGHSRREGFQNDQKKFMQDLIPAFTAKTSYGKAATPGQPLPKDDDDLSDWVTNKRNEFEAKFKDELDANASKNPPKKVRAVSPQIHSQSFPDH
jgi:hypothetical protein